MEHSSPFAQRLKAISARRKLQELILSTRLDLEQEKLRAQRLKRKSLREQWLMEGTSASPGDRDPLSPLREAETRIEELQQSLTSLQSQMQQLDSLETRKGLKQPPSEEPGRDADEGNQSPKGPEKVDVTVLSSSKGRSEAESTLGSAPASPQKPTSTGGKENLQNGGMPDGDLSGNECGPEEAKVEEIPGAKEKGNHQPHLGDAEAASAPNSPGQCLDPGKAPASRQKKLAMEEMVIRDHLGHEVGCMDAVGQNQSFLEKEEELEGHSDLEERCDNLSQPEPVDGVLDQKEVLEEGPLEHELGNRDGPEGESPTSQDPPSPSSLQQNENICPKGQEDRPLETGSLAKEEGQEEVPRQGAQEMPALALATADASIAESVKHSQGSQMPEGQETGATEEGQEQAEFSPQSQVHTQTLVDPVLSPLPEVEPLALERIPTSLHEMKTTSQQGEELIGQEVEESLPDTMPSSPSQLSSLPDHVVPPQEPARSALEESLEGQKPVPPEAPEDQKPVPPEVQVPSRPDSDVFLPDLILPSADDQPGESPINLQYQVPPALEDMESPSSVGEKLMSSPQDVDGALPDEIQTPLPNHASANLPREEGSSPDEGLPPSEEPSTLSLLGQTPSSLEAAETLLEGWDTSGPPKERSPLAEQTPSSDKAPSPLLQDASNVLPTSGQETLQPLLGNVEAVENQEAKGSRDASIGLAGAEEMPEVLEHLSSEQQPLLKEATALGGAALDISVRDAQLHSGIFKAPTATTQRVPNHSGGTSANTATSPPPQAHLPCQEDDQEPERSKRKSCQCCLVM